MILPGNRCSFDADSWFGVTNINKRLLIFIIVYKCFLHKKIPPFGGMYN